MFKQNNNLDYIINDDMKPKEMTAIENFAIEMDYVISNYKYDLLDEICKRVKDNKFDASEIENIKEIVQKRLSQIANGDAE